MTINVLFCIDENFWQHFGVAVASLLISNPQSHFHITVASAADIDQERRLEIDTLVQELGNGTIQTVLYREALSYADLPVHDHLTFAAYLRLFLTEFLERSVDKIIYLDTDVLVVGNIEELWETPLADAYLGAAREPYNRSQREPLGFGPHDPYFNSGVMLINVDKWRADCVLPRFMAFARANPDKLPSVDQDVINSVFRGHILDIGYKWNWQALFVRFSPDELGLTRKEWNQLKKAPRLVHYTSRYKPWYYRWEPHYKEFYYRALDRTPWSNYVPPDKRLKNLPRRFVKRAQRYLEWHLPAIARRLRSVHNNP